MRAQYGAENVFLLDNGDILQGQPICYYYNFYVATGQTNIAAQCTNYLQYDAQTLGNHDVETATGSMTNGSGRATRRYCEPTSSTRGQESPTSCPIAGCCARTAR